MWGKKEASPKIRTIPFLSVVVPLGLTCRLASLGKTCPWISFPRLDISLFVPITSDSPLGTSPIPAPLLWEDSLKDKRKDQTMKRNELVVVTLFISMKRRNSTISFFVSLQTLRLKESLSLWSESQSVKVETFFQFGKLYLLPLISSSFFQEVFEDFVRRKKKKKGSHFPVSKKMWDSKRVIEICYIELWQFFAISRPCNLQVLSRLSMGSKAWERKLTHTSTFSPFFRSLSILLLPDFPTHLTLDHSIGNASVVVHSKEWNFNFSMVYFIN